MSFREKTAWVMSVILTLGGLFYFNKIVKASLALGDTSPPVISFVITYVVVIVIASIVAMSVVSSQAPEEAEAPADERERRIQDRAGNWSGYVLAFGIATALFHFWVHRDGNMLFHLSFASLMVSQVSDYALQIWLYRRGI